MPNTYLLGSDSFEEPMDIDQPNPGATDIKAKYDTFDPLPLARSLSDDFGVIDCNEMDGRQDMLEIIKNYPETMKQLLKAMEHHDNSAYEQAEIEYRAFIEKFPKNFNEEPLLFARDKRTAVLYALGRYEEVDQECLALLAHKEALKPRNHVSILRTARNHNILVRRRGKYHQAYQELASRLETADLEPTSYDYIVTVELLAKILKDLKQYVLAEYLLREVIEISGRTFKFKLYSYTLSQLSEISTLFWLRGHHRRAEEASYYAWLGLKSRLGEEHPVVFRAAKRYSNHLRYQGRLIEAGKILRTTLGKMQKRYGTNHAAVLWTECGLAAVYILQGYIAEGAALLEKARKAHVINNDKPHRDVKWIDTIFEEMQILRQEDRRDETDHTTIFPYFVKPDRVRRKAPKLVAFINRPSQPSFDENHERMPKFLTEPRSYEPSGDIRARIARGKKTKANKEMHSNRAGAYYGTSLHAAILAKDYALVKELLYTGLGDPHIHRGIFGTPIKTAIIMGDEKIVELLLHNRPSEPGQAITDLETAIIFEQENLVKRLLSTQANPNLRSYLFGNALSQAAPLGNLNIVEHLLEYFVPTDITCTFSLLPIQEAGLAAGDATYLDSHSDDYLRQLGSNREEKQHGTLQVLNHLIFWLQKHTKETDETRRIINESVCLMLDPKTAPPYILSAEELENLLNSTKRKRESRVIGAKGLREASDVDYEAESTSATKYRRVARTRTTKKKAA